MSTATEQVWTLGALLDWTAKHLADKKVETPRLDAEVLLAHVIGGKRIDLYGMRHGEVASADVKQKYRELIRKRVEGCPVAYLVGRKEFYGLELKVSPAVLIPRPDSEHVVMECLKLAGRASDGGTDPSLAHPANARGPRILDIGTGSGNLAIALAKHLPTADVTAIDKSPDALAIARENAAKHGVAERIRFLEGDLFAPFDQSPKRERGDDSERFQFIVSNPPYIADEDIPKLPIGVRQYEPLAALQGGPGGFVVFDRLIAEARPHLELGGYLIVEIGAPQEMQAREKLAAIPDYALGPTIHDFSGHPRVLRAQRKTA